MRILLVEDDNMIGVDLERALVRQGFAVDWVKDGTFAQTAIAAVEYTAVLLDLGLPRRSGMEVLKELRARGDRTPVLVLTARDGIDDRVTGLDAGADDYLVKPFEVRELMARLRAVLRRRDGHAQPLIGTDVLQLDLGTRELVWHGKRESLSAREFALMHALLERPGAILSRSKLEERVYGWSETIASNAMEVVIHGLRKRLGPELIRNVRGLGWRVSR